MSQGTNAGPVDAETVTDDFGCRHETPAPADPFFRHPPRAGRIARATAIYGMPGLLAGMLMSWGRDGSQGVNGRLPTCGYGR